MATGSVAVCFRCEWSTVAGPNGRCPRCDVPLYVVPPPAPRREPIPEVSPSVPPAAGVDRGRWRWSVAAAGAALAVLIPAASLMADRPAGKGDGGPARELRPALVSGRTVQVPVGLTEVASEEADRMTFVAAEDTEGGPPYRLWRLDLRSGSLIPGPVVAPVRDLRLHPEFEDTRLGFLAEDGALFSMAGFHAARPQQLAGGVGAFDFTGTRAPIAARVHEALTPREAGSRVRVEVGRAGGRRDRPGQSIEIRGLDLQGVRVSRTTAYLWGVRRGRGLVGVLGDGRLASRDLGRARVVDVSPTGSAVVVAGGRSASVVDPAGGRRTRLGLEIGSVASWSPDGRWMVATGSFADGVEGLWLVDARTGGLRQLDRSAGTDGPAGFSSGGRLVLWTEQKALAALDLATRNAYRIELPPGFPEVVGPLVAG